MSATPHVELTDTERVEAARFWGDYFRSGGKDVEPSAFQLDALNDEELRDRLMMWQIAANPSAYNAEMGEHFETEYVEVWEALGEHPEAERAQDAIVQVVKDFNDDPSFDLDKLDTGAVFVLMHCMWALLGGYFTLATGLLKALEITSRKAQAQGFTDVPYYAPLGGLLEASKTLVWLESTGFSRTTLLQEARDMFGLAEDHPNVVAARNNFNTAQKEGANE